MAKGKFMVTMQVLCFNVLCVCFIAKMIWMLCSHSLQTTLNKRMQIKQQNAEKEGTAASRVETIPQQSCTTHR